MKTEIYQASHIHPSTNNTKFKLQLDVGESVKKKYKTKAKRRKRSLLSTFRVNSPYKHTRS